MFQPGGRRACVVQPFGKIWRLRPRVIRQYRLHGPHSECPHTTMFDTFRISTAYSIALASERSPREIPSAVAGGTRLPTFRTVKSSPGLVDARRSGTTRLSEQAMKSVSGDWECASFRKRREYRGSIRSRKLTISLTSFRKANEPFEFNSHPPSSSRFYRASPKASCRSQKKNTSSSRKVSTDICIKTWVIKSTGEPVERYLMSPSGP